MKRRLIAVVFMLPALLLLAAGAWYWLWQTRSGAEWIWDQVGYQLATKSGGAALEGTLAGNLTDGLTVSGLRYQDANLTARAERVELAASMSLFPAVLTVRRLVVGEIEIEFDDSSEADGTVDPSALPLDLAAPLPVIVEAFRIERAVAVRGETRVVIETVAAHGKWGDTLVVEVTDLRTPEISATLGAEVKLSPPFPLSSQIRIDRLRLPNQAQSTLAWIPEAMDSTFTIRGDSEALSIEGTLRWPDWLPEAKVNGQVENPLANPDWNLQARVPTVAIPVQALGEQLRPVANDQRDPVVFHDLTLLASGHQAQFEVEGGSAVSTPWTSAARVAFEAAGDAGNVLNWAVDGEFDLTAQGWPAGRFEYAANGTGEMVTASVTAPELFGGALSASARTEIGKETPWEADLTIQNVSAPAIIEALSPHLDHDQGARLEGIAGAIQTETIDARVQASGTMDPLSFSAEITQLRTKLRGHEVTAHGRIHYSPEALNVSSLFLESGRSRLVLDGSLYGEPGLEVEVDMPDLADILPGTAGSMQGRIHYRHDRERGITASRLRARLQGRNIRAYDWSVGEIEIRDLEQAGDLEILPDVSGFPGNAPISVSLRASNLQGPALEIASLSAAVAGDFDRQTVAIHSEFQGGRVQATMNGRAQGDPVVWAGKLESFDITPTEGEAWGLRAPAMLRFSERLTLRNGCLTPGGEAELCIDLEQGLDGTQEGELKLASVSLDPFARLGDWPLGFSQQVDGSLTWALQPGASPSANAEFEISPGVIVDRIENEHLITTQTGKFSFSVERGRLQSGMLEIPFDSGIAGIDFGVTDVLAGTNSEIQGRLRVDLQDLDVLAHFVPQLVQTDGRLKVDVVIAGTASDPLFQGLIELHEGRAQVLAPGLRLSKIELVGRLDADNQIEVDGSFRAGEGLGELQASISFADPRRPTFDVRFSGEALTLIDVPDLRLQADTDVTASWRGKELELSGRIHVPTARFAPRYLPSDTAVESEDVVIVAGGTEVRQPQPQERNWSVRGEMEVSMGENVVVDLDLAKAALTGQAKFKWEGSPVPLATGQYDLKGEIQAYGQNLEITRASVRFPGVPANNPHLDIRAERRIYGNSLISHAGVLVHGTLKRPLTEPYTVPVTNADRARALLITGSDFDYEQGMGAVNVGTYIYPRLYLAYGVGLFEEGNVVTARYDLGRNFGIKATSGQDDTGIDISYTIEK